MSRAAPEERFEAAWEAARDALTLWVVVTGAPATACDVNTVRLDALRALRELQEASGAFADALDALNPFRGELD